MARKPRGSGKDREGPDYDRDASAWVSIPGGAVIQIWVRVPTHHREELEGRLLSYRMSGFGLTKDELQELLQWLATLEWHIVFWGGEAIAAGVGPMRQRLSPDLAEGLLAAVDEIHARKFAGGKKKRRKR